MKVKCNICKKDVEIPYGESIELCLVDDHITARQVENRVEKKGFMDHTRQPEADVLNSERCYELKSWDGSTNFHQRK